MKKIMAFRGEETEQFCDIWPSRRDTAGYEKSFRVQDSCSSLRSEPESEEVTPKAACNPSTETLIDIAISTKTEGAFGARPSGMEMTEETTVATCRTKGSQPMPRGSLPLETTTTACVLMRLGSATFSSDLSLLQNLLKITSVGQEDVEAAVTESGCSPSSLLAAYIHNVGVLSELSDTSCSSVVEQEEISLCSRKALLEEMLSIIEGGPLPVSELGGKKNSKGKAKSKTLTQQSSGHNMFMHQNQNSGQGSNLRSSSTGNYNQSSFQPPSIDPAWTSASQMASLYPLQAHNALSDQVGWPMQTMTGNQPHCWDGNQQPHLYQSNHLPQPQNMFGVMGDPWLQAVAQMHLTGLGLNPALGGPFLPAGW